MPSNIQATTIRIDPEVKKEATAILDELGLSMSTAVNAFLNVQSRIPCLSGTSSRSCP